MSMFRPWSSFASPVAGALRQTEHMIVSSFTARSLPGATSPADAAAEAALEADRGSEATDQLGIRPGRVRADELPEKRPDDGEKSPRQP